MFQEFRTKAALRTALLAIRKRRGEDAGRDAALSARLAQLLIEYAPRCAAFYWPVADEFDARAVIQHWLQQASERGAAGGEQRACAVEFLSLDTGIKNEKRTLPDSGAR